MKYYFFFSINYSDAKRLIGRRFNDATMQCYMKVWLFKIIKGENVKPRVEVKCKGDDIEEIFSLLLAKMKEVG